MMTAKERSAQIGAYLDERESLWDVSDFDLAESAAMAEEPSRPGTTDTVDFLRKHGVLPR